MTTDHLWCLFHCLFDHFLSTPIPSPHLCHNLCVSQPSMVQVAQHLNGNIWTMFSQTSFTVNQDMNEVLTKRKKLSVYYKALNKQQITTLINIGFCGHQRICHFWQITEESRPMLRNFPFILLWADVSFARSSVIQRSQNWKANEQVQSAQCS